MKKLLLGCIFAACVCTGLFAGSADDAQFKQYVEATKNHKTNPEGMTVVADPTYRVIYVTLPLALHKSDATPEVVKAMREAMIKEMSENSSNAADKRIIKTLKISIVYSFITIDKNIVTISLSYQDF